MGLRGRHFPRKFKSSNLPQATGQSLRPTCLHVGAASPGEEHIPPHQQIVGGVKVTRTEAAGYQTKLLELNNSESGVGPVTKVLPYRITIRPPSGMLPHPRHPCRSAPAPQTSLSECSRTPDTFVDSIRGIRPGGFDPGDFDQSPPPWRFDPGDSIRGIRPGGFDPGDSIRGIRPGASAEGDGNTATRTLTP